MKFASSLTLLGACALLASCSSTPPAPAAPDGSTRVPANDPGRVQALQTRVAQDRALLTENNVLKAQVDALQQRLNEMTSIVREALLLPAQQPQPEKPAMVPKAPPAIAPRVPVGVAPPSAPAKSPEVTSFVVPDLPKHAYTTNQFGVVIRVFHDYARTEFEPPPEVARALLSATRSAESVLIKGRTDSHTANDADRVIATERAINARRWLVKNGVDGAIISTRYSSAGMFYADNATDEGRALNRRVEIDVRQAKLASI